MEFNRIITDVYIALNQRSPAGKARITSCPRPFATSLADLFVCLLLVTTSSFIFFIPKNLKQVLMFISSAALCTIATLGINVKTLPHLLQKKM
jgi:hypothetical protein